MKVSGLLLVTAVLLGSNTANAWTLPDLGQRYFVGSTAELYKMRAAMTFAAGYGPESYEAPYSSPWQLIEPPWGMGAVDCMTSFAFPGEVYNTTGPYLGMSIEFEGEIVEIPTYEELATQETWPGECYGFKYAQYCVLNWLPPEMICPDPE